MLISSTGIVQGVSFRYYTQKECVPCNQPTLLTFVGTDDNRASKLNLVGWVKNNSDESVEGAAAGPGPAIQKLCVSLVSCCHAASDTADTIAGHIWTKARPRPKSKRCI